MLADQIIAQAAAAHGVEAAIVSDWLGRRGWDFAPLDGDSDPAGAAFVRKIADGCAARIAEVRRAKAEHEANREARRAAQHDARLTQAARQHPTMICAKCDGAGRIDAFAHVESGRCFWCNGIGIIRPPEPGVLRRNGG